MLILPPAHGQHGRCQIGNPLIPNVQISRATSLIGLLDALSIPSAIIAGHDWGAVHAWDAALMRPDRFKAVFCLNVPYAPRGETSIFDEMRNSDRENRFYMFQQMSPRADQIWSDAAITIPGVLYWASGSAPDDLRWNPLDPARSLYRPAPGPLPKWADRAYMDHNIAEFQRTGFHGPLNYYRAAELTFQLMAPWKGAKISQPSFFIGGRVDGSNLMYPLTIDQMRAGLPGLKGGMLLDNVGHWAQHEAANTVTEKLLGFLRSV